MFKPLAALCRAACAGFALACAAAAAAPPEGEAERIKALEQRLADSLAMIERLSARVSALENASRTATATPAASASAAPTTPVIVEEQGRSIAALQDSVSQIAEGLSRNANDTGIPLHGFVDVGAGWSSSADPVRMRGFSAGSLDLYLTPQVGSRVKSLIELVVEFDEDNRGSIDMERVQIGYAFDDTLTLWGGRFHTPFGLWNTSYHHGANLQTSISRPQFIDFEDRSGLIPVHSVGLWANGKVPLGGGKLSYDAYLANGPSVRGRQLELNPFTDDNGSKMVGGNLGYQAGGSLGGLTVGLHAFATRAGLYASNGALRGTSSVRSAGGYFGYDTDEWEALGEIYRFGNRNEGSSARLSSTAGYVQIGRSFGAWTPFVRYERASLDPRDDYFRSLRNGRSYTHIAAGARYAIDANSALKFELRHSREAGVSLLDETGTPVDAPPAGYRRAQFQYSISF